MKILAFAGSLRSGSLNRKLLGNALDCFRDKAEIDLLDLRNVAMPVYDGDLEAGEGLPEGAKRFKERIAAADGLLIATPEYNNSIPGGLKNAIDWASRPPDNPFKGRTALLMAASTGPFAGMRGLLAVRQILMALFSVVIPSTVMIAQANEAFDDSGALKDPGARARIERACAELLRFTTALRA